MSLKMLGYEVICLDLDPDRATPLMLAVVTSKRLTPEEVHAVGVAALDNAIVLLGDAIVLLRADRPQRAFALGVTAVEEVAKFLSCRQILSGWTGITVGELNAALRPRGHQAHIERYHSALDYLWGLTGYTVPLPAGFPSLKAVAKQDMRARDQSLYVEVASSGKPRTPADVGEDEIREWLKVMIGYFAMLERVWREGLDDVLAAARTTIHSSQSFPQDAVKSVQSGSMTATRSSAAVQVRTLDGMRQQALPRASLG
jgi:AbiV family abortive infection protein